MTFPDLLVGLYFFMMNDGMDASAIMPIGGIPCCAFRTPSRQFVEHALVQAPSASIEITSEQQSMPLPVASSLSAASQAEALQGGCMGRCV